MDSKLTMPFENELTNEEITSIDEYVERTYEEHKNNHNDCKIGSTGKINF